MNKLYRDEYNNLWKQEGKFWKIYRDGGWFVTSGTPPFELKEVKE